MQVFLLHRDMSSGAPKCTLHASDSLRHRLVDDTIFPAPQHIYRLMLVESLLFQDNGSFGNPRKVTCTMVLLRQHEASPIVLQITSCDPFKIISGTEASFSRSQR